MVASALLIFAALLRRGMEPCTIRDDISYSQFYTDCVYQQSQRTAPSIISRRRLTETGKLQLCEAYAKRLSILPRFYLMNSADSIKKPKTSRYPSLKGTDPKFRRNHRHALHGTMKALVGGPFHTYEDEDAKCHTEGGEGGRRQVMRFTLTSSFDYDNGFALAGAIWRQHEGDVTFATARIRR